MPIRFHTGSMFTLAFLVSRHQMRQHLIGALADHPVLPDRSVRRAAAQRAGKLVDRRAPAQRRAHVPLVAPQPSRGDEHLL